MRINAINNVSCQPKMQKTIRNFKSASMQGGVEIVKHVAAGGGLSGLGALGALVAGALAILGMAKCVDYKLNDRSQFSEKEKDEFVDHMIMSDIMFG